MKGIKARRRSLCRPHFGCDDMMIDNFIWNHVHLIPDTWQQNQEVDFYLDTGDDIYLVIVRNIGTKRITFCGGQIGSIVIEKNITSEILTELRHMTAALKEIGIPDTDTLNGQVSVGYPDS